MYLLSFIYLLLIALVTKDFFLVVYKHRIRYECRDLGDTRALPTLPYIVSNRTFYYCSSLSNWTFLMYKSHWVRLVCSQRGTQFGELMFSLSYLPTAERLTVVIVKARNLKFPQDRESGDPFVKVKHSYVCCDTWTADREYRPSVTTTFISVLLLDTCFGVREKWSSDSKNI